MDQLDNKSDNSEFYYDYSILPHTIIQQVFANLSTKDIKNCLQTCKSWYYVSLHPRFTKPLEFSLTDNNITVVSLMNRKYRKVKLNHLNFTKHNVHYLKYFKTFGEHIEQLDIHKCGIDINQLIIVFKYLKNLARLEIDDCNNIFNSKALFSSKITSNDRATILANLNNIKWLRITSTNMNYETLEKFLSFLTRLEYLEFTILSKPKLTNNFERFVSVLSKLDNTMLRNLSIAIEDKEEIILERFDEVKMGSLKSLKIQLPGVVDSDFMWDVFCKKFAGLEEFNIKYNHFSHAHYNQSSLPSHISSNMVNLKRLYMTKVGSLYETLFRLEHLEVLHITTNMEINQHNGPYVETLVNIDLIFIQLLPNLKCFAYDYLVRDTTLDKISEFCPNLENLQLEALTTLNCDSIFKNLLKLKKLRIIFVPWLTLNKEGESDIVPEYTISRLVLLEELYTNLMIPNITKVELDKLSRLNNAIIPLFSMNNKKIYNFYTKFS